MLHASSVRRRWLPQKHGAAPGRLWLRLQLSALLAWQQTIPVDCSVSSAFVPTAPTSGEGTRSAAVDKEAVPHQDPHEDNRRLALISTEFNASTTALTLALAIGSPIQCLPSICSSITGLYAGLEISNVEVGVDPDTFFAPGALLRVVRSTVNRAGALLGHCLPGNENGAQLGVVNDPWAAAGVTTLGSGSANLRAAGSLHFKMGGTFRLCYSDDGSFTNPNADVVPPTLFIYGLFDSRPQCAATESCLTLRQHRCYLLKQSYNNPEDSFHAPTTCIIDFDYTGAGFEGPAGKGSWSKAFEVTYDAEGLVTAVTNHSCGATGDTPATFLCGNGAACDLGDPFIEINITSPPSGGRLQLPAARNDLQASTFVPRSVAACYCPDFDSCDSFSPDFLQQVGILHFYTSKVCGHGFLATQCDPDYTGSSPDHRFALRVECPTDACWAAGKSSIKVVARNASNELPSWHPEAGCSGALHGVDAGGHHVLPAHTNFLDPHMVHGGYRQDYKLWNFRNTSSGYVYDVDTSGFLFVWGHTDYERLNGHMGETFDVCYCDDDCMVQSNWFKVGQMRFAPFQLVSAATNESSVQDQFIIEYVNQPGMLGFYRPWSDYGVRGLQPGGMVKPVQDNMLNMDNAGCAAADYDRTLIQRTNGLSELTAHLNYVSSANETTQDPNKLVFNGGSTANMITILKPGFLAICYCSAVNSAEGSCENDHWVMTARITIRGPTPGQSWLFSTHVVFRFEFTGWGLTPDDKVRLIPRTSSCSGDPSAAFTETAIKVNCPSPCSEVGDVNSVENGDIQVLPLSDDAYSCDEQNALCRTNYVKAVTVLDENTTSLEFEAQPFLETGDLITLGDNIFCDDRDPPEVCNEERLSMLKGRFRLVDRLDNNLGAPDEYTAGHAVTATADNKVVTIGVGWMEPRPRFVVRYVNNRRGRWIRHSKAITRQEIMGTRERMEMKVCWKYAPAQGALGPLPTYVGQVGTLTLRDANPLAACKITLTTSVIDQRAPYAPFILSFQTASEETGRRYSLIQGTTRLRIFFDDILNLHATFADGGPIESNPGEDDIGEARQYICGKLFKELWSSDTDLGFPMPQGCYYRAYDQTQELNMLLDVKNGLRPDQHYQMVLSGVAGEFAMTNGVYAQVFTMEDTDLQPYNAIERGTARLSSAPQAPWYGSDGVKFMDPDGVKIVGGTGSNILEMRDGHELRMELKGDPDHGGIKRSSIVRIFLWPLTQWDVPTDCVVQCVPHDDVTAPCGAVQSCKGDSLILNFQKNFLRIILPVDMTTIDNNIIHTLVFPELTLPGGGFFPTRFALQVTQADDTKPHYIETVGDYLYKVPDEGQGVGKLVDLHGDGNERPFRGDEMNILYVRMVLAATMFAVVQTGDAVLTLALPEGYECIRTVDIDGRSPWRAEDSLSIFGDQVPQGTGLPDEGSGARGWSVQGNTCIFTLRQNAVIYAGSALTIRVTANNPQQALRKDDPKNRWNVALISKGYHQFPVTFPAQLFKTSGTGNYSDNMAVLGRLSQATLTPTNFAVSTDVNQVSTGELRIFFRTEQATGVFAGVELGAPPGFLFLPSTGCTATDLEGSYYVIHAGGPQTRPLPGITSCEQRLVPYNHAMVGVSGSMLADTLYGFRMLNVQNPSSYTPMQQAGWTIFTLDSSNGHVDGLPHTIPLTPLNLTMPETSMASNLSFGLYQQSLNMVGLRRVEVVISNLLPFSLTGQRALVRVLPLRIPMSAASTMLRIIAPHGFHWDFTMSEFKYRFAAPNASVPQALPGVTADLPGGTPVAEANLLVWQPASYDQQQTYGLEALARVPDRTPTSSVNEFIVQFGYAEMDLSGRLAASTVQARIGSSIGPPAEVRALVGAMVDYTSNVQGKGTDLIFQVETLTPIQAGGGLRIVGPPGFIVSSSCSIIVAPPQRGSPYNVLPSVPLPSGVACSATLTMNNEVEIHVQAGVGSEIHPGRYRFQIAATNPAQEMANPQDAASSCGYLHCWRFDSLSSVNEPTSVLDAPISVPSFTVNTMLVEALIPTLTVAQQAATKRDDRPAFYNPLVLAFKMNRAAREISDLKVRAPQGSVFRENCLQDVEVRGYRVFGEGQPLPAEYGNWDIDITVLRCRGEGPDAMITIDAAGNAAGLLPEVLYPFRIALLHNPAVQPSPNLWTLEFNGEASDPFPGYDLWTFTRTSIHTVDVGRSTPRTGAVRLPNPVTFTFNPHNQVSGIGLKIKVTAPQNFRIAHTDYKCSVLIQLISAFATGFEAGNDTAPHTNFDGPPALIWRDADVSCTVDVETERTMTATVLGMGQTLLAGRDYQLTVRVNNPTITTDPADWLMETEASSAESGVLPTFRDWSLIGGYRVLERVNQWLYRNEDPVTGIVFNRGVTDVLGLYFEMQFPLKLENGDYVKITAPQGFNFAGSGVPGAPAACGGFRWEPLEDADLYLPNSLIQCQGPEMSFHVREVKSVPENRLIKFRVNTRNPAKTPHIMRNFWLCTHWDQTLTEVRSTSAAESWTIIPQLYNVNVLLTGALKAEGSLSTLAVSFAPVSNADQMTLSAQRPTGFDFTGCLATSVGHEVIATSVEMVRVRASIYADVQVDIVIDRLRLGVLGGPTEFNLATMLNNGVQMDEAQGFTGGFRLPGRVTVTDNKRLESLYSLDPSTYPISSLWDTRMGEEARAEFEFRLTLMADRMNMIRLRAAPYELFAENFNVVRVSNDIIVTAEVISASLGGLVARLGAPLWAETLYKVRVNVRTPLKPNPTDAMWSIDILDDNTLPLNTNDAQTEGFQLVDRLELDLSVTRSPPVALVTTTIDIDPATTRPEELRLIAPPGFGFPADCLVSGGTDRRITGCARIEDINGRAVARLTCQSGGLQTKTEFVQIRIETPAQTAALPNWYIEGRSATRQLGWGEDPHGVDIRQMLGAGVLFPGIPSISGQMVYTFITSTKVEAGGTISAGYPQSITVSCDGAFLQKIALEGEVRCTNFPREGRFDLLLSRPLPPGTQAFAVTSTSPYSIREENVFYAKVLDNTGQVVDAAMNIPGGRIQHGLALAALDLIWSLSEANTPSTVSMGFELLQELPEVDPPVMSELVVELPPAFAQQVTRLSNIEVLNNPMPWRGSGNAWLNVNHTRKLGFLLDEAETVQLPLGRYRFSFPVKVPSRMPKYNVFILTVCGRHINAGDTARCTGSSDPRAMVSFPLAGFALGQVHPSAGQFAVTGSTCRVCPLPLTLAFVLLSPLLSLRRWEVPSRDRAGVRN